MKSIIQTDDDRCFLCEKAFGTDTHHVFGAAARKWSDKDGLTVRLCRKCRCLIHEGGDAAYAMHQLGQITWEMHYGPKLMAEGKDVRKAFMERYGKNYL